MSMVFRFRVNGIFLVFSSLNQFLKRMARKSWLNGPQYDRKAVHTKTSPTSLNERSYNINEANKTEMIKSEKIIYKLH